MKKKVLAIERSTYIAADNSQAQDAGTVRKWSAGKPAQACGNTMKESTMASWAMLDAAGRIASV